MKPHKICAALIALSTLTISGLSFADESPVGVWKSIDDKTGKAKAIIRITEVNGELQGKIEKLFLEAEQEQNPKCDKCEGATHNQPIIGMTILTGLRKDGDEFSGGKILDPGNGKLYSCKLSLSDKSKVLNVRGYIGVPWLGRSQIWHREP